MTREQKLETLIEQLKQQFEFFDIMSKGSYAKEDPEYFRKAIGFEARAVVDCIDLVMGRARTYDDQKVAIEALYSETTVP